MKIVASCTKCGVKGVLHGDDAISLFGAQHRLYCGVGTVKVKIVDADRFLGIRTRTKLFELDDRHSMTLRVALSQFAEDLQKRGLGDDEHGRTMVAGYLAASNDILRWLEEK